MAARPWGLVGGVVSVAAAGDRGVCSVEVGKVQLLSKDGGLFTKVLPWVAI